MIPSTAQRVAIRGGKYERGDGWWVAIWCGYEGRTTWALFFRDVELAGGSEDFSPLGVVRMLVAWLRGGMPAMEREIARLGSAEACP